MAIDNCWVIVWFSEVDEIWKLKEESKAQTGVSQIYKEKQHQILVMTLWYFDNFFSSHAHVIGFYGSAFSLTEWYVCDCNVIKSCSWMTTIRSAKDTQYYVQINDRQELLYHLPLNAAVQHR